MQTAAQQHIERRIYPETRPDLRLIQGSNRLPRSVYMRRQLVTLTLIALVLLAMAAALGGRSAADPERGSVVTRSSPSAGVHVVQPGDTLWDIVRASNPSGDIRPMVDQLHRQRQGRPLVVGERVKL